MKHIKTYIILTILFVSACATPPQLKELSLQQIKYFDLVIKMTNDQSNALILASEKLVTQAKTEIDNIDYKNRSEFEKLMLSGVTDENTAKEITRRLHETSLTTILAKEKLDEDIKKIRENTEELKNFIIKMREIEVALDAYIQSEKAGEAVVTNILKQKDITALIDSVSILIPKIQKDINEINKIITDLK